MLETLRGRLSRGRPWQARWRGLVTAFRLALLETVIILALLYLHPFQVFPEAAIDDFIIIATQFCHQSSAPSRLAVVLIDENTLDDFQHDWPLTYRDLAGIAHQISCAGAMGIFFDIIPARRYNLAAGRADLLNAVIGGQQAPVHCPGGAIATVPPIYFATAPTMSSDVLTALNRHDRLFSVQTAAGPNSYPVGESEFPDHPPSGTEVTPAFGLLRRYCGGNVSTHELIPLRCPSDAQDAIDSMSPIFLSWSGNIDPQQPRIADSSGCITVRQDMWNEVWTGVKLYFAPQDNRCPPILTLRADDLYRDAAYIAEHGVNPSDSLKGRIVFVGVDLAAVNDVVVSPVHGQLPGVFVHAVALENLLSFGAKYHRQPYPRNKFTFLGCFIFATQSVRLVLMDKQRKIFPPHWVTNCIISGVIIIACATVFAGWLVLYYLRWPPSVMVALSLYVIGLALAVLRLLLATKLRSGRPMEITKSKQG